MPELLTILVIDVICIILCISMMYARLAFYHPFSMYLFFHLVVITIRGWQLYYGAPPLYSDFSQFQTVTANEIYRAVVFADISLVFFTIASWLGHYSLVPTTSRTPILNDKRQMSIKFTHYTCYVCLPVGILFFIIVQGGFLHLLPKSSYFTSFAQWTICCLLMLTFLHGFKRLYVIPIIIYLLIVALQGYHRTQLILPMIFLTCFYLYKTNRKWPPAMLLVVGLIGFAIFPQLKYIGKSFQEGDYQQALAHLMAPLNGQKESRNSSSLNFLDQFAGALTLRDQTDKYYYGSTYFSIVTLPIPRVIWPEKPGLADHIIETSTYSRQYSTEVRIITYIGESYFNFGYIGLILLPVCIGFLLSRWFHRVLTYHDKSLSLCLWLVVFSSLIQVFRDGLTSLITFTIMINTPLFFVAFMTYINRKTN